MNGAISWIKLTARQARKGLLSKSDGSQEVAKKICASISRHIELSLRAGSQGSSKTSDSSPAPRDLYARYKANPAPSNNLAGGPELPPN